MLGLSKKSGGTGFWIAYNDQLMSVFMMLVISVAAVAGANQAQIQEEFAQALKAQVGEARLQKWDAEIVSDGTMRFNKPDSQFETGKAELKDNFKHNLDEFIPIYINVLNMPQFKTLVREIHIDGHSSRIWNGSTNAHDAYFNNLELSQRRTVKTLAYIINNPVIEPNRTWYLKNIVSNGYGSSRPKIDLNPDAPENQRVEFKVIFVGSEPNKEVQNYDVTITPK